MSLATHLNQVFGQPRIETKITRSLFQYHIKKFYRNTSRNLKYPLLSFRKGRSEDSLTKGQ